MKKLFVVALLFVLTLSFSSVANAAWIDIGYEDKLIKAIYIDDDVSDEGSYCTMWVKTIYRTPLKLPYGKKSFVYVTLQAYPLQRISGSVKEVNTKRFGLIAGTHYDANNNFVASFDFTGHGINWLSIPPDTGGKFVAGYVRAIYDAKYNR